MTPFHSIAVRFTKTFGRWLCLLLVTGCVTGWVTDCVVAAEADPAQIDLRKAPQIWAEAATAGDMAKLMSLYSREAFIHVVFTKDELHGYDEIFSYYEKYEKTPPRVTIVSVDEAQAFNGVGILSGTARVEFQGQEPMMTHFSTVLKREADTWVIQLQHIARIDGK